MKDNQKDQKGQGNPKGHTTTTGSNTNNNKNTAAPEKRTPQGVKEEEKTMSGRKNEDTGKTTDRTDKTQR